MTILRIVTSAGITRLNLDVNTCTLNFLKTNLAEKLNISKDSIQVKLDDKSDSFLCGETKILRDFGILDDGTKIYVNSNENPEVNISKCHVPKKIQNEDLNKEKSDKHFESFESYVKSIKYDVSQLPLSINYEPVKITKGELVKLPSSISLKRQKYRSVDHLEIMNAQQIHKFTSDWIQSDNLIKSYAFLIGYFVKDENYVDGIRAVIEAIHQPHQNFDPVTNEVDFDMEEFINISKIAQMTKMSVVGIIYAHYSIDSCFCARDIMYLGNLSLEFLKYNIHYTQYPINNFIILSVSYRNTKNEEPSYDTCLISDLCLALIRDDVIKLEENKIVINNKGEGYVMPTILENGKNVTSIDPDWFIVKVVESIPVKPKFLFKQRVFPFKNASELDFMRFINRVNFDDDRTFSDFNFIVFIAHFIGIESINHIIDYINERKPIPEDYQILLTSLVE